MSAAGSKAEVEKHPAVVRSTPTSGHLAGAVHSIKSGSLGSQSGASFGSHSKIVRRAARGKGVLPPSIHALICPTGSPGNSLSSPLCKNILLRRLVETAVVIPPSRPTEGRWPSSLTRGGMRWTRQRRARAGIAGRDEPRER